MAIDNTSCTSCSYLAHVRHRNIRKRQDVEGLVQVVHVVSTKKGRI
jgi:hypothetical protein